MIVLEYFSYLFFVLFALVVFCLAVRLCTFAMFRSYWEEKERYLRKISELNSQGGTNE